MQLLWIDAHLQLSLALAPYRDVRHARYARQARLDRPAGQHGHLDQGKCVRGEPDLHAAVRRRDGLKHHRWLGDRRQGIDLNQALLHHLPSLQDVGPRLEKQLDRREPRDRFGVDLLNPGRSVEHVRLHRRCNHGLDFFGAQPQRFGL